MKLFEYILLTSSISLFPSFQDKVMRRREETAVGSGVQNLLSPEGMLTPPASSRKSLDVASFSAVSEAKPT